MPRNKHHYHSPWSKLSSRVQQAANTASAHVRDLYAHTATKTSAAWDSVSNHAHKATQEATYAASKAAAAAADKLSVSSASSAVKSINSTVHNAASTAADAASRAATAASNATTSAVNSVLQVSSTTAAKVSSQVSAAASASAHKAETPFSQAKGTAATVADKAKDSAAVVKNKASTAAELLANSAVSHGQNVRAAATRTAKNVSEAVTSSEGYRRLRKIVTGTACVALFCGSSWLVSSDVWANHFNKPRGFENYFNNVMAIQSHGKDEEDVWMRGRLTNYLYENSYEFTDEMGNSIAVELDDDIDWTPVYKDQLIEIYGEIDRNMFRVKVEVKGYRILEYPQDTQESVTAGANTAVAAASTTTGDASADTTTTEAEAEGETTAPSTTNASAATTAVAANATNTNSTETATTNEAEIATATAATATQGSSTAPVSRGSSEGSSSIVTLPAESLPLQNTSAPEQVTPLLRPVSESNDHSSQPANDSDADLDVPALQSAHLPPLSVTSEIERLA